VAGLEPVSERTQFWSNGGGTQSAAIAALIIQGKLPKPDLIAISDTGRERSSVWKYQEEILAPALKNFGIEIHRVACEDFGEGELWEDWGNTDRPQIVIPVFINNATEGRLNAYCSDRWKKTVMHRWLREQGVKTCDAWIGYSLDEMSRIRVSKLQWYRYRYPLVFDVPMRRGDCIRLVEEMGWPEPPKSACWMCPNRDDENWLEMKRNWPGDFEKACAFEREMQQHRPDFFLHRSLRPLDSIDFSTTQRSMFRGSDENSCTEGCFT
jgi:hypothetical protein